MALRKIIIGNELYLYRGNILIYKRWISRGYGKVFHDNEGLTQFIKCCRQQDLKSD